MDCPRIFWFLKNVRWLTEGLWPELFEGNVSRYLGSIFSCGIKGGRRPARRTLDATSTIYAWIWLWVRHLAPTAISTGT